VALVGGRLQGEGDPCPGTLGRSLLHPQLGQDGVRCPEPDVALVSSTPVERAIVVGDTPFDVEAAKKAGIRTTGLLCAGFSEKSLREAGAIEVYRDPEHLLQALEASEAAAG